MTSHIRSLTLQPDYAAFWRRALILIIMVVLVAGAAWLAFAPTTVSDTSGVVTRKWTEGSAPGQPATYWIEVAGEGQPRRCSIAAYQTQLVTAWEGLAPGGQATLTCYGQSAVSLAPTN